MLNFWKFTSYCSLKPLWSGMGEVVPACTSPTLYPPSPPTVHQLSQLALEELIDYPWRRHFWKAHLLSLTIHRDLNPWKSIWDKMFLFNSFYKCQNTYIFQEEIFGISFCSCHLFSILNVNITAETALISLDGTGGDVGEFPLHSRTAAKI